MNSKRKKFFFSAILILLAIGFTVLVKVVDVKQVGVNETSIGFATVNQFVFNFFGVNMIWYHITDWLGLVPIFMAISYALIGLIQLIKRKSLFKVDKELIILGIFYIIVIALYLLFEKVIINYRPILMDGFLEASYPSSHTLMTICLCGSSIIVNKALFNNKNLTRHSNQRLQSGTTEPCCIHNKITKFLNILSIIIILITIIGRLISGVHWFTDIIGGIFISMALLMNLSSIINLVKKEN